MPWQNRTAKPPPYSRTRASRHPQKLSYPFHTCPGTVSALHDDSEQPADYATGRLINNLPFGLIHPDLGKRLVIFSLTEVAFTYSHGADRYTDSPSDSKA
jgi:hypothetical protein